ncbi:uncharacterized protein [Antedon mediterranea]|uniref:uncharacterized protein n=1 Tax=Antedon mediterranea TaxID=105859 RepID=UPI003AF7F16C
MSSGCNSCQNVDEIICNMGSHLTWDELKDIQQDILRREETILSVRRVDFDTLPTYFISIKNLYGYILFKLHKVNESIDIFKEVLQKDPDNLNAVRNLFTIYKVQGRRTIASVYKRDLDRLCENKEDIIITRAFCERAHAVRHFQQDCREFTYMPYLCQALEFSNNITIPEKGEWLFDYGLALFRKDFQFLLARASSEEKDPNFNDAINTFYKVIQVERGCEVYKALSWVFMGILLRHDATRSLDRCFPKNAELHGLNSIDCIEKGLQLSPEHQIVTRRVASEFSRVGRHEEAAKLFTKSLSLEKSWFAYRHQGLMYIRMYEETHDTNLLAKAEGSLKQAIEKKDVHADHSDLGYVYFLKREWDNALQEFLRAKYNQNNDNFDTTETHRRWAECLKACGEYESATLQQELADALTTELRSMIDEIEKRGIKHGTDCNGNECNRHHSQYRHDEREGFVSIKTAHEIAYRPRISGDRKPFRYDFFLSFCHIDHKWASALLKKLENDFDLIGCIRYRDYGLGYTIIENIMTSIKESHKTIIIMSPDSIKSHYCNEEIRRALDQNVKRKCIIPIMLRECEVPETLETMQRIECVSGQFHKHHWHKLGEDLKYQRASLKQFVWIRYFTKMASLDDVELEFGHCQILDKVPLDDRIKNGVGLRGMSQDHEETLASHRQSNTYGKQISKVSLATHVKPNYKHDFYVISSESDRDWVVDNLVPKLESEHKLKGYLIWRDSKFGDYVLDARVDAMFNSRYIIVILSPNFRVSFWIKYELNFVLHDAIERLPDYKVFQIMIEQCEVPNELQPFSQRLIRCSDGGVMGERGWERLIRLFGMAKLDFTEADKLKDSNVIETYTRRKRCLELTDEQRDFEPPEPIKGEQGSAVYEKTFRMDGWQSSYEDEMVPPPADDFDFNLQMCRRIAGYTQHSFYTKLPEEICHRLMLNLDLEREGTNGPLDWRALADAMGIKADTIEKMRIDGKDPTFNLLTLLNKTYKTPYEFCNTLYEKLREAELLREAEWVSPYTSGVARS